MSLVVKKELRVRVAKQFNELIDIYSEEYSEFKTILENKLNLKIDYGNTVHLDLIENCSILVIGCPQKEIRDFEIKWIQDFVDMGGSLLLINGQGGDESYGNNLSILGKFFGIRFDHITHHRVNDVFVEDFIPPITTGIATMHRKDHVGINYRGCGVNTFGGHSKTIEIFKQTPKDKIKIMGMYHEKNKGRVVGIGSCEIFIDKKAGTGIYNIEEYANTQLVINIFHYLSENFRKNELKNDMLRLVDRTAGDKVSLYHLAEELDISVWCAEEIIWELVDEGSIKGTIENYTLIQEESIRPIQIERNVTQKVNKIKDSIPKIDDIVVAYYEECFKAYYHGLRLSCAFLLGGVSERSINLLIESYINFKSDPNVEQKLKGERSIKRRFEKLKDYFKRDDLSNKLKDHVRDPTIKLFEFDDIVDTGFKAYRLTRNDVGHPILKDVDSGELELLLSQIDRYLKIVFEIRDLLDAQII